MTEVLTPLGDAQLSRWLDVRLDGNRVSEKLGNLRNGVRRDRARDRAVDAHLFRLPRELWEASAREPVRIEGFDGCGRFFGVATGT